MTRRTPKELLKELRKILEAQKKRKKRNPVVIAKVNNSPKEADDYDIRCGGSQQVTAGRVKTG